MVTCTREPGEQLMQVVDLQVRHLQDRQPARPTRRLHLQRIESEARCGNHQRQVQRC